MVDVFKGNMSNKNTGNAVEKYKIEKWLNGESRTDKICKISSLKELNCGLEMIEKGVWRLEDRAIKNIQSEEVRQSGWNLRELEIVLQV